MLLPRASILHALRVLQCHGMNDAALKTVYHAVVISRLLYAASAWWGLTTAADRQVDGLLLWLTPTRH